MHNVDLLNVKATDFEGSVLWGDLADISTIAKDASNRITQINDKSALGTNHMLASGVQRPTYDAVGFDGKPTAIFDGTSNGLSVPNFTIGAYDIFIVMSEPVSGTLSLVLEQGTNAGFSSGFYLTSSNAATTLINKSGTKSGKNYKANWITADGPMIANSSYNGTHASNDLKVNGIQVSMTDSSSTSDPGTADVTSTLYIGSRANSSFFFEGLISEIIIYNRKLSDSERSIITAYLGLKWGISVPEPVPYALDGGILAQPTPLIDLLKDSRTIDGMTNSFVSALPKGYLYESPQLQSFFKGFMGVYQEVMLLIEKAANDQFYLNEDSLFIDEYLTMYGLPNILFPEIENRQDALFAISMMKLSSSLLSKQDFENFLALLGFNVTFYPVNSSIIEYETFNYTFPILFSNSITKKDKLTYWIYVEEDDPIADPDSYNNIGDAFDIDFITSPNKLQQVQKILAFLKPDYLIFQYISLYTKNLYGL